MKPLNPELLRHARPALTYVVLVALTGIITAGLIIAQCFLIANAAAPIIDGRATFHDVLPLIGYLALVIALRAVVQHIQNSLGHRASLRTIAQLRSDVLERASHMGPRWLATRTNQIVTLTSRGLDALEPYFVAYIPQLILCATVTPATLLIVLWLDWLSAVMLVFCIPLIPIFMILIGKMTASHSAKKLAAMQRLGDQVLDLIAGLPTLKGLGREQGPKKAVKSIGDEYTKTTMSALRVAFLSGTALEFLATLSTALVAVEVGLRMVYGYLDLATGLAIIMLTPEIFKPLREVGSQYHNSADGVAAADQALEILRETPPASGSVQAPNPATSPIELIDLSIEAPGRGTFAPANLTATIEPGKVTALAGPNGAGKTTTVRAILGLLAPTSGDIRIDGRSITTLDRESWWSHITWVPQRPVIPPGTIADHVGDGPSVARAAQLTGLDTIVDSLPDGWQTPVGHGGVGLSVGQRQRLALTRALVEQANLVILDEPTAHLDAQSEQQILSAVRALKEQGATVLVIAHRPALLSLADHVITVSAEVMA